MRNHMLWMLGGRIGFSLAQWLIVVLISQMLGAEALGSYSYALAVCGPVFIFSQLNLANYLATDARSEFPVPAYVQTRIVTSVIALLLIVVVSLFLTGIQMQWMLVLIGLTKFVESLSDIFYGLHLKNETMKRLSCSLLLRGAALILSVYLSVLYTQDLQTGLLFAFIAWLVILLVYDSRIQGVNYNWMVHTGAAFSTHSAAFMPMVKTCLPMAFVMLISTLSVNMPVYLIEHYQGVESLGIYTAVAYFYFIGRLVSSPMIQALAPRLARWKVEEDFSALRRTTRLVFLLLLIFMVLALAVSYSIGEFVLCALYGEHMQGSQHLLFLVLAASSLGFLSQYLATCLTVSRQLKQQLYLYILIVVLMLIAGVLLTPTIGILTGGLLLCLSEIMTIAGNLMLVDKRFIRRL